MCFRLNLVGCVANSDTQWCTGGAVTTRLFPTALHDEYASSSYSVVDYCMQVTNLSSAADRPSFNYHGSVYLYRDSAVSDSGSGVFPFVHQCGAK